MAGIKTKISAVKIGLLSTKRIPVTGVLITNAPSSINSSNSPYQLNWIVYPLDASDKLVTFQSSDNGVATVSSDGLITLVGNGSFTVTITTNDGGFTDDTGSISVVITVSGITLDPVPDLRIVDDPHQLTWTISPPNASNTGVTFKSSDYNVIRPISSGLLLVNSYGADSCTITITTDDGGYTDSVNVNILKLSNGPSPSITMGGYTGYSVAMSDKYIVAGNPYQNITDYAANPYDSPTEYSSGRVAVFSSSNGALLGIIDNPNPVLKQAYDYFGWAVSVTDDYLAISAPGEDMTYTGQNSGKVYMYNPSTRSMRYRIDRPTPPSPPVNDYDYFGRVLKLDDNLFLAGSQTASVGGVVWAFNPSNGSKLWYQDGAAGLAVGGAIGLNSSNVLISDVPYDRESVVRVYNTSGTYQKSITNPDSNDGGDYDGFGKSLALGNSYVVISAPNEDLFESGESQAIVGAYYVYSLTDTSYQAHLYRLRYLGNRDYNWICVYTNDTYLVVSNEDARVDGTRNRGIVLVYRISDGTFLYALHNPTTSSGFGRSVSMNGNRLVVGAYGKIYVYDLTGA